MRADQSSPAQVRVMPTKSSTFPTPVLASTRTRVGSHARAQRQPQHRKYRHHIARDPRPGHLTCPLTVGGKPLRGIQRHRIDHRGDRQALPCRQLPSRAQPGADLRHLAGNRQTWVARCLRTAAPGGQLGQHSDGHPARRPRGVGRSDRRGGTRSKFSGQQPEARDQVGQLRALPTAGQRLVDQEQDGHRRQRSGQQSGNSCHSRTENTHQRTDPRSDAGPGRHPRRPAARYGRGCHGDRPGTG